LKKPLTADEVLQSLSPREGVDTICTGKSVVYTTRLISMMSKSRFTKMIQMSFYQNITIRNWNTTVKLAEMMQS
jgi:uncharacterized protein (DUF1697 family)